ncbi:MAG: hypothetical protein HKP25_04230 [Marinicaulis sp.]|nr:hypothetical protein [Marinicaulis sp.]
MKQVSAYEYNGAWGVNSGNRIYWTGALDLLPGMGSPPSIPSAEGPRCPDGQTGLLLEDGSMDCPNAEGVIEDPNEPVPYYGLNWMQLRLMGSDAGNNKPFNRLLIPGTHDSATMGLTFDLAADKKNDTASQIIHSFPGGGPAVFKNWGIAQRKGIYQQLMEGVRFLDIRVCFERDGIPYVCHGNRGMKLQSAMEDIQTFFEIGGTGEEIVIIWFQHVYSYDASIQPADVAKLETILSNTVKPFAIPSSARVTETYESLRNKGNVLIIMDDHNSDPNSLYDWVHKANDVMCTGWASTESDDFASNKTRVDNGITKCNKRGNRNKLFYTPLSITPENPGRYLDEITGSLISFARRTNPVMLNEFECNWKNESLNILAIDDVNIKFIESIVRYHSTGETGLTCDPNMPGWD